MTSIPKFQGQHILLVEDNLLSAEVASELLSAKGLDVDLAKNGREAVERARAYSYDLILMDVQMPLMNGLEATRLIRSMSHYCVTPILAMSANVFEEDRRACVEAGMDDFVAKPVNLSDLFGKLTQWLPAR